MADFIYSRYNLSKEEFIKTANQIKDLVVAQLIDDGLVTGKYRELSRKYIVNIGKKSWYSNTFKKDKDESEVFVISRACDNFMKDDSDGCEKASEE